MTCEEITSREVAFTDTAGSESDPFGVDMMFRVNNTAELESRRCATVGYLGDGSFRRDLGSAVRVLPKRLRQKAAAVCRCGGSGR
jgi:hypothetical protein